MARSIEQCREKIAELKKEQARYTNDGRFCPWFQIGGHILQIERRLGIMLGRERKADHAALDKPLVLTGDPAIDTLNRIERDRHIAKQNAKHPEHPYIDTSNLAPVDSVPLPAAVLANVATVEPEPDIDALITSLLPPSDEPEPLDPLTWEGGAFEGPTYDEDGNEL